MATRLPQTTPRMFTSIKRVDLVVGELLQRAVEADAGVANERTEWREQPGLLDDAAGRVGVPDVEPEAEWCADLGGGRLGSRLVDVGDDDLIAAAEQLERDRPADASRTTGHDRRTRLCPGFTTPFAMGGD